MQPPTLRTALPVVLMAALASGLLAACGGFDDKADATGGSPAATVNTDGRIAAMVPSAFRGKTLVVATDASYAPMEFIDDDGRTIIGADADLAVAIAKTMGVEARLQNANLDSILTGIRAGRYSVGMSSFTDTKELEKEVDFVTYMRSGSSFYTPAGGATIEDKAGLCGLVVAVQDGTVQHDDAEAQAKECGTARKLTLLSFPDQNAVILAVTSGRAQVGIADTPMAAHAVKQSGGKLELSGLPLDSAPYGIALPKGSGLDKPVLEAVKALIANGTYKAILDRWGLASGAIDNPKINGAES